MYKRQQHGLGRDGIDDGVAGARLGQRAGHVMGLHAHGGVRVQALRIQRHLKQRAGGVAGVQQDQRVAGDVGQRQRAVAAGAAAQVHQFGICLLYTSLVG